MPPKNLAGNFDEGRKHTMACWSVSSGFGSLAAAYGVAVQLSQHTHTEKFQEIVDDLNDIRDHPTLPCEHINPFYL